MAKKKESTLINMLVALLVIAAVSGGVLGLVYGVTKDTIAKVEADKNAKAIAEVLPLDGKITYNPDTLIQITGTDTLSFPCTLVYDSLSGKFLGAAVKTSEGGFGGKIELMVGITADDTITGTSVLAHSETPGLGANMTGKFKDQFVNRKPGDGFILEVTKNHEKEPQKVDAITAATITSRAYTKAVEKAYQVFEANKDRFNKATSTQKNTPEVKANEIEEGGQSNE